MYLGCDSIKREGSMSAERVFAELQTDASTLHASIRLHLERNFAPDARKHLRTFSSTEAADFLGLAPGHLRKLHAENKIPDVPLDERGRKFYSAEDLGADPAGARTQHEGSVSLPAWEGRARTAPSYLMRLFQGRVRKDHDGGLPQPMVRPSRLSRSGGRYGPASVAVLDDRPAS